MKFKKVLALALAGVLSLSLAACGETAETPTGGTETNTGSETTTEKTKVTAWAWDANFNVAALKEAEAIFEAENENIDIEVVEYAQDDIIQKLNTALSSGTTDGLPNIVLIEDYRVQTFLQSYPGSFTDLSSITDDTKFSSHKLGFMTEGDAIYGVPFDNSGAVLYYRRDIVEKAGYTEEDMMDLTWEEYIEMGKKIKAEQGIDLLTLDPNDVGQIRMMMQSANTWYVTEDGSTPNFVGNEPLKYAIEIYLDILEADISKTVSEWSQFVGAPNNGEVATVPTGCWFTASIAQAEDQSGLWGIAPFPRMEGIEESVNASNLGGSSFYVLNDVEGKEAAIEYLGATFAGSNEFYQTILDSNNVLATYLPAQEGDSYTVEVEFFNGQQIYSDISTWSENIPAVNYGLHTYAFEDILKAQMQSIIGGADIDEALEAMQAQAESQFN